MVIVSTVWLLRIPTITYLACLPEVVAREIYTETTQWFQLFDDALWKCVTYGEILQTEISSILHTPRRDLVVVLINPRDVGIGWIISIRMLWTPCIADTLSRSIQINRLHRHTPSIESIILVSKDGTATYSLEHHAEVETLPLRTKVEWVRELRVIGTQIYQVFLIELSVMVHILIHIVSQTKRTCPVYCISTVIIVGVFLKLVCVLYLAHITITEIWVKRITFYVRMQSRRDDIGSSIVYQLIGSVCNHTTYMIFHLSYLVSPVDVEFPSFCLKLTFVRLRSIITQDTWISDGNQHIVVTFVECFHGTSQTVI